MKAIREWLQGVDQHWFGHGSPVAMGVLRIIFGILIFVNFAFILIDFEAWFTETGFTPEAVGHFYFPSMPGKMSIFGYIVNLPFDIPRINLLSGVTNTWIVLAFYIGVMVAAILTALGLWTRVSTILLALGVVTLHHRNGLILHGGDTVVRIMALYLALAPSGAACSLDRVIALWKGKAPKAVPTYSMWVQKVLQFNVALIYFTTFWHKLGFGSYWQDLTATHYTARLAEFYRFPVPGFLNEPPFIYITTFATLAIELSLGTLVFYRPLRNWILLAGVGLHLYIEYAMNIPMFSFLMIGMYVSFYSGEEITEFAKKVGERFKKFRVRIITPNGLRLKPGPASAFQALDAFSLVSYEQGTAETWDAVNARGEHVNPYKASWTRSPGAWLIGWLPTVWPRLMNKALEPAPAVASSPNGQAPKKKSKVKH